MLAHPIHDAAQDGGTRDDAKDIFQDALIIFHRKVRSEEFVLTCAVSTYLFSICRNLWREELRRGFAECFRVLRPDGVLIFKWCEDEIPVSQILALTTERPLFGHRSGKQQKTHWIAFLKEA